MTSDIILTDNLDLSAPADKAHIDSPCSLTSPGPSERVEDNSQQSCARLSAKLDLAAIPTRRRVSAGDVKRGQPCRRFQPGQRQSARRRRRAAASSHISALKRSQIDAPSHEALRDRSCR